MGWTGLVAAVPDASGKWATSSLAREPDVDSVARELAQAHSAAIVCFVFDSDIGYAVADASDGKSVRLVINEAAAREYEMDFLPLGRSADAAADLAEWAREHGLQHVDPNALRGVLEEDHVFAEEGAAKVFELLGLTWNDDAAAVQVTFPHAGPSDAVAPRRQTLIDDLTFKLVSADELDGYATAEGAARGDIPERYVLVLGVRDDGCGATVWMLTNDRPPFEEYTMWVVKDEHDRWHSGSGVCGFGSFNGVDAPAQVLEAAARHERA